MTTEGPQGPQSTDSQLTSPQTTVPPYRNWFGPGSSHINAPDPREWLAAIIDGSADAIISKDLNGIIRSWNAGAVRLFGYEPTEAIGKPVTIIIPEDRLNEEPGIISKIRSGERVEHFETVRRRKDGSLVELSLTISPIRNVAGIIVGASKIARDITDRRQAQEKQKMLLAETQHRVKNLFAVASSLVSLTAKSATSVKDLVDNVQQRLLALSAAHTLTMKVAGDEEGQKEATDLKALLAVILKPYDGDGRINISGPAVNVPAKTLTEVSLLFHELATNAAKYGALSTPNGRVNVKIAADVDNVALVWTETGGPAAAAPLTEGFGSRLEKALLATMGATLDRAWSRDGLNITALIPASNLVAP